MPIDFQETTTSNAGSTPSGVDFQAAPKTGPNPPGSGVGGFLGNVGSDIMNAGGAFFHAIAHPIDTAKNLGNLALGAILPQKALAPTSEEDATKMAAETSAPQKAAVGLDNYINTKYGSMAAFRQSLYEQPVQTMLDISTVLGGAGGLASKAGEVAKFADADRLAGVLSKASDALNTGAKITNPMEVAPKISGAISSGIEKTGDFLTKDRSVLGVGGNVNRDVQATAKELGVNLPASALSDSKATNFIETISRRGLFGGKLQQQLEDAVNSTNNYAKGIVDEVGKSPDLTTAGIKMAEGAQQFRSDFYKIKNSLYDEATIPKAGVKGSAQISVDTKPVIQVLDDAIAREKLAVKGTGQAGDLQFLQGLRSGIAKGSLPLEEARAKLQLMNGKTQFGTDIAQGTQGVLRKAGGTLSDKIDEAISAQRPDLKEALDNANDFYKYGTERINSSYGQKILENVNRPDVIVKDVILAKPTSASDIPNIYDMIGPEAQQHVQASFLQNMFDSVRGTGDRISGVKLENYMNKTIGDEKLQAILTDQQYGDLVKLRDVSKALDKSQKLGEGSQTAFLIRTTGEAMATLGSLFAGDIHGFLSGVGFILGDAALSKFVSSPIGQRFLTEGAKFQFAPDVVGKIANIIAPYVKVSGSTARGIEEAGNITNQNQENQP